MSNFYDSLRCTSLIFHRRWSQETAHSIPLYSIIKYAILIILPGTVQQHGDKYALLQANVTVKFTAFHTSVQQKKTSKTSLSRGKTVLSKTILN